MVDLLKEDNSLKIGIEVTTPELARLMDHSIDPQHEGGDPDMSAIFLVKEYLEDLKHLVLLNKDITFYTVRPDLDSIGSMALLTMLFESSTSTLSLTLSPLEKERIGIVHEADTFSSKGEW
jgi:hypothetical protein